MMVGPGVDADRAQDEPGGLDDLQADSRGKSEQFQYRHQIKRQRSIEVEEGIAQAIRAVGHPAYREHTVAQSGGKLVGAHQQVRRLAHDTGVEKTGLPQG